MPSISETWGTSAEERRLSFPCDLLISNPDAELYRGISIAASPATVFRWLCQMRVAPYSYDWIDNGGKQSPPNLTPEMENLALGQELMRIFTLSAFEKDRHLTLRLKQRSPAVKAFGDIALSYVVQLHDNQPRATRLLVKFLVKYETGLRGRLMSVVLPWGDLIMMRRQLLNLKLLAEESER